MDKKNAILDLASFNLDELSDPTKQHIITNLEQGQIIYMPTLTFPLDPTDNELLSDSLIQEKNKKISFDYRNGNIKGFQHDKNNPNRDLQLFNFMRRFAEYAQNLLWHLLPQYQRDLQWGKTYFNPSEIKGVHSKRKDHTRLHVESFQSAPVHGLRILRMYCNINPYGEPHIWNTGQSFEQVLQHFAAKIPDYSPFQAKLLHWLKATKTKRSAYDHYMLNLTQTMRLDDDYQRQAEKTRLEFAPESTWLLFSDQVSHAAISGQYVLEQTFYLPVEAMVCPHFSPLKQWKLYVQEALT